MSSQQPVRNIEMTNENVETHAAFLNEAFSGDISCEEGSQVNLACNERITKSNSGKEIVEFENESSATLELDNEVVSMEDRYAFTNDCLDTQVCHVEVSSLDNNTPVKNDNDDGQLQSSDETLTDSDDDSSKSEDENESDENDDEKQESSDETSTDSDEDSSEASLSDATETDYKYVTTTTHYSKNVINSTQPPRYDEFNRPPATNMLYREGYDFKYERRQEAIVQRPPPEVDLYHYAQQPVLCVCPHCHCDIETLTIFSPGCYLITLSLITFICCGIFCLCCWFMDENYDVKHYCPNCGVKLGTHKKESCC
uniref:protein PFC0760c-like n=1 Tax=Styela clava TaxID=7725 RepID=UPI0019396752|nr:protein PFC0760c-like [Styela clava]